jgi:PIN domain nuclease of toxin-antitoxin system
MLIGKLIKRERSKNLVNTVLDSSAVLALLFDEPTAGVVEEIIAKAADEKKDVLINVVNWAEVLYKVNQIQGKAGIAAAKQLESESSLKVVDVDCDLAEDAALLKAEYGIPLADSFCAALALKYKAVLVTGDMDFKPLERVLKKIIWLKKE